MAFLGYLRVFQNLIFAQGIPYEFAQYGTFQGGQDHKIHKIFWQIN